MRSRALRTPTGEQLAARAGVLTGEAAVTLAADGQGMVAGDLVNTASRLQSVAPPGAVLVGEATVRATGVGHRLRAGGRADGARASRCRCRPGGRSAWWPARGGSRSLDAARGAVRRPGRRAAPAQGAAPRHDAASGGRAWSRCIGHRGHRQEPARLGAREVRRWAGRRRSTGTRVAHRRTATGSRSGRSPRWSAGARGSPSRTTPRRRPGQARRDGRRVPRRCRGAGAGGAAARRAPGARAAPAAAAPRSCTAAWRTLFERIADRGPTVLVFEDLHWADPGLLDFIEGLLDRSARTGRSWSSPWRARSSSTSGPTWGATVAQPPAARPRAARRRRDGACCCSASCRGSRRTASRTIRERAAGIPLYAVETVRMLLDQRAPREQGGRFRLDGDLGDLGGPGLAARRSSAPGWMRSSRDVRDLVGHAAVLGISFDASRSRPRSSGRPERRGASDPRRLARAGAVRARRGPALAGARPAPVPPGRPAGGRLRPALASRSPAAPSRRRRAARGQRGRRARRRGRDPLPRGRQARRGRGPGGVAVTRPRRPRRGRGTVPGHRGARERGAPVRGRHRARRGRGRATAVARGARRGAMPPRAWPRSSRSASILLAAGRERGDPGLQARAAFWAAGAMLAAGQPADAVRRLAEIRVALGPFVLEDPDGVRLLAELGRCQLMAGEGSAALPVIDEALVVAQRLGLTETIGELLASKGWALGSPAARSRRPCCCAVPSGSPSGRGSCAPSSDPG